ncbi:hypothetical protein L1887_54116 [Cichorium endivia]|nr:hypothetical protein L1887_54116 [Cichorium endivia]
MQRRIDRRKRRQNLGRLDLSRRSRRRRRHGGNCSRDSWRCGGAEDCERGRGYMRKRLSWEGRSVEDARTFCSIIRVRRERTLRSTFPTLARRPYLGLFPPIDGSAFGARRRSEALRRRLHRS